MKNIIFSLLAAVAFEKKTEMQNILLKSYKIGSTLGLLAISYLQESEADEMRMMLRSLSGYNYKVAINVWKCKCVKVDQALLKISGTNSSNEIGIAPLTQLLPKSLKLYVPQNYKYPIPNA